jgi:hypothetical protein
LGKEADIKKSHVERGNLVDFINGYKVGEEKSGAWYWENNQLLFWRLITILVKLLNDKFTLLNFMMHTWIQESTHFISTTDS